MICQKLALETFTVMPANTSQTNNKQRNLPSMIRFQGLISDPKSKDSFKSMNMALPKKELLPKMQTISSRLFKRENMVKMDTVGQSGG
jgi:hypothetical protein